MHALHAYCESLSRPGQSAVQKRIRTQRLGHLHLHNDSTRIIAFQMLRPNTKLYRAIRTNRIRDRGITKIDLSIPYHRINNVHRRASDKLGGKQRTRGLINLKRRANLFRNTSVHYNHTISHCHCLDLIMSHVERCNSQLRLQFFDLKTHLNA